MVFQKLAMNSLESEGEDNALPQGDNEESNANGTQSLLDQFTLS